MINICVIGGGASGLVAGIAAAKEGARVTILEHKERLGKKILSTGNGRCNLTNEYMETSCFRGEDLSFIESVLKQFGYKDEFSHVSTGGGASLEMIENDGHLPGIDVIG